MKNSILKLFGHTFGIKQCSSHASSNLVFEMLVDIPKKIISLILLVATCIYLFEMNFSEKEPKKYFDSLNIAESLKLDI